MSKTTLPFHAGDISAVARSLRGQLANCDHPPGHVELLNMLARSAGCRNFQHFRAQAAARDHLAKAAPGPAPVDHVLLQRLTRYFDEAGRLIRWPSKFSHRAPCLWVIWSKLPPRQAFTESGINQALGALHLFGDHALLRRELCDSGMMTRTRDGRDYRRVERCPPAEALALIRHLSRRPAA